VRWPRPEPSIPALKIRPSNWRRYHPRFAIRLRPAERNGPPPCTILKCRVPCHPTLPSPGLELLWAPLAQRVIRPKLPDSYHELFRTGAPSVLRRPRLVGRLVGSGLTFSPAALAFEVCVPVFTFSVAELRTVWKSDPQSLRRHRRQSSPERHALVINDNRRGLTTWSLYFRSARRRTTN